jgi:Gamma-glutamyl cyclotransferase, AIG2-like
MRFFFYGTLMDPEILEAVLQRSVDPIRRRKAVLNGYRRVCRRGAYYPVLIADTTAQVEGIVVSALTTRDIALLTLYEGQEYEIRELPVSCSGTGLVRTKVFLPGSGCEVSSESWTPEDWNRRFRQTFVRRVTRHRRASPARSR